MRYRGDNLDRPPSGFDPGLPYTLLCLAALLPSTTTVKRMRLWSIHPRYLDPAGLVSQWREALLAREVLRGKTRGYRHHPQLLRFRGCAAPLSAINSYLAGVHADALVRGYRFDASKLGRSPTAQRIDVTTGQLDYEWDWLLQKLARRNPPLYELHRLLPSPPAHPLFSIVVGPIADWERP